MNIQKHIGMISFLAAFFISSCTDKMNKNYIYLETCFEDYYLNYGADVKYELLLFEKQLITEKHLADSSGRAYKNLLAELSHDVYFSPPLKFDAFNNAVLYKVPDNLMECATSIFGLDSSEIVNTPYFKVQDKIREDLLQDDSISIGNVFNYNAAYLSAEDFNSEFVRYSTLQLLYRWYFQSKYNREIPLTEAEIKAHDEFN
jgi:hypothetical protein